jgi:hypothetical protein
MALTDVDVVGIRGSFTGFAQTFSLSKYVAHLVPQFNLFFPFALGEENDGGSVVCA